MVVAVGAHVRTVGEVYWSMFVLVGRIGVHGGAGISIFHGLRCGMLQCLNYFDFVSLMAGSL